MGEGELALVSRDMEWGSKQVVKIPPFLSPTCVITMKFHAFRHFERGVCVSGGGNSVAK